MVRRLHEACDSGIEETPFGGEELSEDDVAEIVARTIPTVENLEELMLRDDFWL
jgi:hypothetical protein